MPNNRYTFNEEAYLAANPDVAQKWDDTPWQHYLQFGQKEGRNAIFDKAPEADFDPTGMMKELSRQWFQNYTGNSGNNVDIQQQLNELKEYNPKEFYTEMLGNFGKTYGWQIGQNTNAQRGPAIQQQIQSLIPEAKAAGLTDEQINNILNTNVNAANIQNQQRIANQQASGNFWTDNLIGAAKVGALALSAYGLDSALGGAGLAGAEAMGPTYAELGYVPAAQVGSATSVASELMGPTYGELGYTGLAEGAAGPTYAELGYTGLNQNEAIALADAAAKQGISFGDAYKAYSRTKQLGNLLNSAAGMSSSGKTINPQALASALQTPQEQFGGLYRMNQNPFAQTQQPTTVQNPFGKTQDFLAQLAEESKPEPTLADLLRNA